MIESLRSRADFEALRSSGRYDRSGPLALRSVRGGVPSSETEVRVAYAIGKSVGNAVVRNRIRRRLRVLVSEMYAQGEFSPGKYLVIVNSRAVTASFQELQHHLHRLVAS